MKKTSIILGIMLSGVLGFSQTRMTLYEEFTGENCPPCAATNPGLDAVLAANPTKVIALKWQVPIPSAPSNTWSLYQTNKAEINWRYMASGYGYQSQNTPTNSATGGINSAPQGRFDGQHQWVFGATSNHPTYVNNTVINNAANVSTPFSINMSTAWDPTFSNAVVTVTLTSSGTFNAVGALMFRLCLVERKIEFDVPSGTNGEKLFHDVVRKSYPTVMSGTNVIGMGTAIPNSWVASQTHTLSINCAIPSYIVDKGQMAFVGFIQDDGDKKVWQAARTAQPAIPNEAKAISANVNSVICTSTVQPSVTILNNGANAITDMTITPYLNGVQGTDIVWTGNLAVGGTTTIPMNVISPVNGSNTFSFNISGVSGGDIVTSNNSKSTVFLSAQSFNTVQVNEGFQPTTFPPTGWSHFFSSTPTFVRYQSTNGGGFGASTASARIFVNGAQNGVPHHLILPPTSLTGTVAPAIKFDLAYCQVSASNNDKLDVAVSTNCGTTWTNVYTNQGSTMATAPTSNTNVFYPTATQWTAVTIPVPSLANNPNVLVRFSVTPNYGNNLFLDNIMLYETGSSVGINEENLGLGFDIYPNPATDDINLRINSAQASKAKVILYNSLGQIVYSEEINIQQGFTGLRIDSKNIAAGLYQVALESENNNMVKKITIAK